MKQENRKIKVIKRHYRAITFCHYIKREHTFANLFVVDSYTKGA